MSAEHDENEVRKAFTVSERVAIADAMRERMPERRGRPGKNVDTNPQNLEVPGGEKTREHVARKAGFESDFTHRARQGFAGAGLVRRPVSATVLLAAPARRHGRSRGERVALRGCA